MSKLVKYKNTNYTSPLLYAIDGCIYGPTIDARDCTCPIGITITICHGLILLSTKLKINH
jgi:hypothetical protein